MNYINISIKGFVATVMLVFVAAVSSVSEANVLKLSGQLVTDENLALAQVKVQVSNHTIYTDVNGQFEVSLPASLPKSYQFTFSKAGFYQAVRTFSLNELQQQPALLGQITLVEKKAKRTLLAFTGDAMLGRRYFKPYFDDPILVHQDSVLTDAKSLLSPVKPYLSLADFSAVNLETQIAVNKPSERAPKSVTFYSPPELLTALEWAGVDYVSLGNNHTYDYLDSGLKSTIEHLQNSNLGFSGAGFDEQQALAAYQHKINGVSFGLLGYVGWQGGFTPNQTAGRDKGGAAFGDEQNIINSVKQQVSKHTLPIVQYHGSQEYANEPTNITEHRLKSALDAGAVLAIAHHPHVTQGLEIYDNKLIAYSMGNFLFDQNFSATQHSYLLHVWLDDGEFYRAEIIPLYIKGYQPTPATGMHRVTVLKRLAVLSAKRNTYLSNESGHGVIVKQDVNQSRDKLSDAINVEMNDGTMIADLYQAPWQKQLVEVNLPNDQVRYRLGTNLINGSDFESFSLFDSDERGWLLPKEQFALAYDQEEKNQFMQLTVSGEKSVMVGQQSFRRVYNPSSPMTLVSKMKSAQPVTVKVYWQGRKNSQKLLDAFKNSEKHLIAERKLSASELWQNLAIEFNSPRVGYRSYRILMEIVNDKSVDAQVALDDVALIEWQTPFSRQSIPLLPDDDAKQAMFIGTDLPISAPIQLSFQ